MGDAAAKQTLAEMRALVANEFATVNDCLRQWLHSDVALINTIVEQLIQAGGKRLRPMLVLLCAKCLPVDSTKAIELAAIIELIHTATLLHDDVVDDSKLRRGSPTANALFGNSAAVLSGDFLYSRAFQQLIRLQAPAVLEELAATTNEIAQGEVMQLLNLQTEIVTEKQYLATIHAKTAILFRSAALGVGQLANTNREIQDALATYGLNLGLAFQLIDDLLDYSSEDEKLGKQAGDDFREGKQTLPLIYLLEHGTSAQHDVVRAALRHRQRSDFQAVATLIASSGAQQYTFELARSKVLVAQQALEILPASSYRDALYSLADFALTRST